MIAREEKGKRKKWADSLCHDVEEKKEQSVEKKRQLAASLQVAMLRIAGKKGGKSTKSHPSTEKGKKKN